MTSSSKLQRRANDKIRKRWQLFHATDFESLMYPTFTFCYILGIFPYKINSSVFETSTLRYIFSTIITCVYLISLLYIIYVYEISGNGYKIIPRILNRSCFYILSGFIAIITYILSGPRMRLLQTIKEISSKLPSESYQKLSKLIHTKDLLGSFFLIIIQLPIYFNVNVPITTKIFVIYASQMILHMDMLYMNCVCILKACFKGINDNLENMQEHTMVYHLDKICYKQRSSFLLIELKTLKKQHLMISNTVQMLNMIFSLQLLATIIMTFTQITFTLYFYVLYWQINIFVFNIDNIYNYMYPIFLKMCTIYYFIKLTFVVWACETGKDQALQIGITVHDVLNSVDDNEIKRELQMFSLQIMHCDNTFSAKGFTVDATLLASVNYLVIICFYVSQIHFFKFIFR
ncbi:Putative gustatory receptor 28b [Trachymyrmex zeteki]|uniref:Gustatory receptor n=1 Tax=Mycetomoellerius zeteki TaxID=64791 RepID=A0A151WYH0_9HYME|nr:Putative gustatory receptor 28b [Trachymyrmex zeteki]